MDRLYGHIYSDCEHCAGSPGVVHNSAGGGKTPATGMPYLLYKFKI